MLLDPLRTANFIQAPDEWSSFSFSSPSAQTSEVTMRAKWAREMTYPRSYLHEFAIDSLVPFPSDREEVALDVEIVLPSFLSLYWRSGPGILMQRFGGSYGGLQFVTSTKHQGGEGDIQLRLVNENSVVIGILSLPVSVYPPSMPNEERLSAGGKDSS